MASTGITRRTLVGAAAGLAGATALGSRAFAQLALPKSALTINVMDITGDLSIRQKSLENYRKLKPELVSKFNFQQAPQPDLPGKLKAQQDAGRLDIDLVLASYDGLTGGFEWKLWLELLPTHANVLPKVDDILLDGAKKIQALCQGQGIVSAYTPYGPVIEYMPDRVKKVPTTAEELMAWTKENKNRFLYGRPANSGPGRALMTGLPYMLGDSDPRDPVKGWDKTWAYLTALSENIEYYPAGTAAVMKEFGDGTRDMIASSVNFDIRPRVLGIVPKEARIQTLKGIHWGTDAHVFCVPKGIADDRLAVVLDIINFLMTKEQQAYTFAEGDFYPGPAIKGVTLDMAPPDSQKALQEYGRPEYEKLFSDNPHEPPLEPRTTALAFRRWDEQIGSQKKK